MTNSLADPGTVPGLLDEHVARAGLEYISPPREGWAVVSSGAPGLVGHGSQRAGQGRVVRCRRTWPPDPETMTHRVTATFNRGREPL